MATGKAYYGGEKVVKDLSCAHLDLVVLRTTTNCCSAVEPIPSKPIKYCRALDRHWNTSELNPGPTDQLCTNLKDLIRSVVKRKGFNLQGRIISCLSRGDWRESAFPRSQSLVAVQFASTNLYRKSARSHFWFTQPPAPEPGGPAARGRTQTLTTTPATATRAAVAEEA